MEEHKKFIVYETTETNTFGDNGCPFLSKFFCCFGKRNTKTVSYVSFSKMQTVKWLHFCALVRSSSLTCFPWNVWLIIYLFINVSPAPMEVCLVVNSQLPFLCETIKVFFPTSLLAWGKQNEISCSCNLSYQDDVALGLLAECSQTPLSLLRFY